MKREKKGKRKYKKSVVFQSYLVLSPQIIGFFVFSLYPIYYILRYSFTDYDGLKGSFVGLANYIEIFTSDATFWNSLANTFIITGMRMVLMIPLSFFLAMLLCSKSLKAKRLFSTALFLPSVIGVATTAMIFRYIFRTYNGLINNIFMDLGILNTAVNWLGNKWTALLVTSLMATWMNFPIYMMYFCGAISGVSEDLYEAAKIDGCGWLRSVFSITLPLIAPIFKVILMLEITGAMKTMNTTMLLTNGGPNGKTNVVMLYLYNLFFGTTSGGGSYTSEIGYASAGSIILTVIIGIITVIYLRITKKLDELC
ncbi:MAG: sugar ABC transporter permease [Lachnospiraceae bacterium]|nr:sugar ABC transporter permease [Lachnospiraceae bacterium]